MMTLDAQPTRVRTREYVVERLSPDEVSAAVGVIARGMRDNPLHVAAFGTDPATRVAQLQRLFGLVAKKPAFVENARIVRNAEREIVGIYSAMSPGACIPSPVERVLMAPLLLPLGMGNVRRVIRWLGEWAKHDPDVPHWHFGPIAVDAHLQGQGIGSAMLRDFCARMDEAGEHAYLETDKQANVRLYERFGFEVVDTSDVIGTTNWFMLRSPQITR